MVAVGLSVMPEPEYLAATLPLFEAGVVDMIEWSFDMSWRRGQPDWLDGLIADYSAAGLLAGHGVSLSPLSSHPRQDLWFDRFAHDVEAHSFTHVSEHFGFMAAGPFRAGPPLPLPFTAETLAIGQAHLQRLADLTGVPVGLENLAFAFGTDDVWTQGEFLDALLEPVDGFLVLDVHNLWCQVQNFDLDVDAILASYPLHRVRECHVSGGSWSDVDERRIRRDTHDGDVPADVFDLLATVLSACPAVESVVLERIGATLGDAGSDAQFRDDFAQLRSIVGSAQPAATSGQLPTSAAPPAGSAHPAAVMEALDAADSPTAVRNLLRAIDDAPAWARWIDQMDPAMVQTARELMATWGVRDR